MQFTQTNISANNSAWRPLSRLVSVLHTASNPGKGGRHCDRQRSCVPRGRPRAVVPLFVRRTRTRYMDIDFLAANLEGNAVCATGQGCPLEHLAPCREGGPGSREAKQSQTARIQRGNKGITHPEVAYAVYCSRKHVVRSALSQRATEGKSAPQHEKETWPRGIRTPNCKVCARLLEWFLPESQLSTAVRSRGEISTLLKPPFNGRKRVLL